MPQIEFRPLAESDLPLLFTWLARPHVAKWYAPSPLSFMEVAAKYGPRTVAGCDVDAYVIVVDGAQAGYIQKYRLEHFPEYRRLLGAGDEEGLAGMDLFLGDEWRTGHGLGTLVIRRFFLGQVLADAGVRGCVAGPHEGNLASIRAFEKAGFRRWKNAPNERGEVECVLRRDRDLASYRIAPIELARGETCVRLFRDMYAASFNGTAGLEELMGPGNRAYLEQLRARIAQFPEGNAHLWRDGEIVGQLEMRLLEDEPEVAYLSVIHVVAEHRGRGLGRKLHDYAMEQARLRGRRLMRLSVSRGNAAATRFYRRSGWVVVGARESRGQPLTVMETPVR